MNQTNIINFVLALIILLLIFKLIFYNHEYEQFNSNSFMNCRKYPYLCNDNNPNQTQNQNASLYETKRPEYLSNVLDVVSPRYNPSSRNKRNITNNRNRNNRNMINNRNNTSDSTVFTRRRFFDPQANVL